MTMTQTRDLPWQILALLVILLCFLSPSVNKVDAFRTPLQQAPRIVNEKKYPTSSVKNEKNEKNVQSSCLERRSVLEVTALTSMVSTLMSISLPGGKAAAKCTDIDSCRDIGERKVEADERENPTTRLPSGVRYKILQTGLQGARQVTESTKNVDMIYSISTAGGGYMYSKGFGFEKVKFGSEGQLQSDAGLDSLLVTFGRGDVPVGIEQALVGMSKGERRRVELPPSKSVGFESSNWQPEPTTRRGKTQIQGYQKLLKGNGSSVPPFPAPTIWDIEVLSIRD